MKLPCTLLQNTLFFPIFPELGPYIIMGSYFCFFNLNTFSGADLRIKTTMLFTPLLAAIRYSQPGTVALLLEKGADMMVINSIKQYNPIMWAVEMENPEILKV